MNKVEASLMNLQPSPEGAEHVILRVYSTDVDGYGNKVNFPLIALAINDSPSFVATRSQLIELIDEVFSKAKKAVNV